MKASDYRREYEQPSRASSNAAEVTELKDAAPDVPAQLLILADTTAPEDARWNALQQVQAATFLGSLFDPYRAEYLAILRNLATDDSLALRRTALERLSALKDPFAQQLLSDGLRTPAQALVSTANALEFLSMDEHSAVSPLARLVLGRDEEPAARVAALRTLTADPSAQDLFARLMRDKAEFKQVRQVSAIGLQKLNAGRFQEVAREIATDTDDFDDIRATVWSGLASTPLAERLLTNPAVRASAEMIGSSLVTGAFKALLSRRVPDTGV